MGKRGRPKGSEKTPGSGRKKGSGVTGEIRAFLKSRNINIIEDFLTDLELTTDPAIRNQQRLRFMDFVYPKPRMDVSITTEQHYEALKAALSHEDEDTDCY